MIKIEKKVKLPTRKGKPVIYPILDMEIGDSFFVETNAKDAEDVRKLQRKMSAICITRVKSKKLTMTFTVRIQLKPLGVRIWRTK